MKRMFIVLASALLVGSGLYSMEQNSEASAVNASLATQQRAVEVPQTLMTKSSSLGITPLSSSVLPEDQNGRLFCSAFMISQPMTQSSSSGLSESTLDNIVGEIIEERHAVPQLSITEVEDQTQSNKSGQTVAAPAPQFAPIGVKGVEMVEIASKIAKQSKVHSYNDAVFDLGKQIGWNPTKGKGLLTVYVAVNNQPGAFRTFTRLADKWYEGDVCNQAAAAPITDVDFVETLNALVVDIEQRGQQKTIMDKLVQIRALYSAIWKEAEVKARELEIGACRLGRAAGQHVRDHLGAYSRAGLSGLAGLVFVLELAGDQLSPIGYATATLIPGAIIAVGPEAARLVARGAGQLAQVGQNAIRKAKETTAACSIQ